MRDLAVAAHAAAPPSMACNLMDAAARRGVQAFVKKRPPGWKR